MTGFSIREIKVRIAPELVEAYRGLPTATVSDCMSRLSAGGASIRPLSASSALCGPAFTVKCRPGDNLMVHKALDIAQPGDVLVVDAGGDLTNSIAGEIMISYAQARKLGGLIINGAIRDSAALAKICWPVFAAGITHRGPMRSGPGEIGEPIAINGMVVEPGDLIVGDDDGILCVPCDVAAEVLDAARKKLATEDQILRNIRAGDFGNRRWVDETLTAQGCKYLS